MIESAIKMRMQSISTASGFIDDLLGQGRYTFTREEATKCLKCTPEAAYYALYRLVKAKRLAMPRSGFYVIVDPQHRSVGILPPEWFVHDLMRDIGNPYYVGLLSAAQLHGAAHHRPQVFQVVIPKIAIRPIETGNVSIRFYGKGPFDKSEFAEVKTPTGKMLAATPETTAWDLVRYPRGTGGLDNIITVLSELALELDATRLLAAVKKHGELIVAQRLGYILERLGQRKLAKDLAGWVKNAPLRLLDPSSSVGKAKENERWRLLINAKLEPEA